MLTGIKVFASDSVWHDILEQMNATLVDDPMVADANIDVMQIDAPITPMQLKSAIIAESDNARVLNAVFGHSVRLSALQTQIIVKLYRSGGMSADKLKVALGYAQNTKTHIVDTAIYGLRELYGHDFIKNDNGVFKIGKL